MNALEKLLDAGYEDVIYFTDFGYDDALIGVAYDNGVYRAVYNYGKMVEWLIICEEFDEESAMEWIDYNTIRALPYMGKGAPIIMYDFDW